jgi:hypothetical protein
MPTDEDQWKVRPSSAGSQQSIGRKKIKLNIYTVLSGINLKTTFSSYEINKN